MRLIHSGVLALGVTVLVACSEDAPGPAAPGDAEGSGGSSTGGRSAGSGGKSASSSGGLAATSSGGVAVDPALARACGVDAGVDPCRSCLAVTCCAAAQACFADAACAAAYAPYQACVAATSDDVSRCFSDFSRTVLAVSRRHEPLLSCIAIGGCSLCGPPGAL